MTRKEILDKATECVCGQRQQDYGNPEDNFGVIADLWRVYLENTQPATEVVMGPVDVAIMMALMKIGRIMSGTMTDDSFVDACGYLACAGEIAGKSHEKQKASCDGDSCSIDFDNMTEMKPVGVWTSYTKYDLKETVLCKGKTYVCLCPHMSDEQFDPKYWEEV